MIPFLLVHAAALGVFWTGFTTTAVVLCISLYLVRMWALTAGFHRYFSHRSYKTSRWFQFVLAFLGQMSAQRGVLWWAATHRHHHRHSDTPEDVHSPKHAGFWFSHVGWIFSPQKNQADYSTIKDFTKYPELRFLNRHPYFPAFLLAVACYLIAGWPGLFVGFFLSTVILYHGVFAINSVAHVVGKQRYVTADDSRNNWWLALLTLGEGWHNNHHHYQSSTRQGFYWWEVDISYYVLKAMSWVGLVWDLRAPPKAIVEGEQRLGQKVVERVAEEVAGSFQVEQIARELQEAWASNLEELRERAQKTRENAVAQLRELQPPNVPTMEQIRARLRERYLENPSLDQIAERAQEIVLERLSHALKLDAPSDARPATG
ncbi:MAG: acyl-CoA desaturase [Gemmatimonadales bacterium]|nr:MAG: acyl-CoA desaturase [Gemmatimonadales bacterium]